MKCLAIDQAISISTGGQLRPCCMMEHAEHHQFPFVDHQSIAVYQQSDWLEDIRNNVAQRQEPKECRVCYANERLGLASYRNYINSKITESNSIEYLDLHLGNACNSECAMCCAEDSSRVEQRIILSRDLEIFPEDLVNANVTPTTQKEKWFNQPGFFEWFKTRAPNLKLLKLLGGEPFLIENVEVWVDWLIANDHAKNITLHFNTNASILNQTMLFKCIKQFKQVIMHTSVDGTGKIYNWIRHGLDWIEVEQNILEFCKYSRAFKNKFHLTSECVVQTYNLRYLLDLLTWSEQHSISLNWIFITTPAHLSIANLQDKTVITEVIQDLEKYKQNSAQQDTITKLLDYLNQCLTVTEFPQDSFIRYTKYMNSFRTQKFNSTTLKIEV